MIGIEKKKSILSFLKSPISIILLFLVLILLLKALFSVYTKQNISNENLIKERSEFDKLSGRKDMLVQSIEYLKTDNGIESEIRNKYRMVKEGEFVAIIVDKEDNYKKPTTTNQLKENRNFILKIFDVIFSND